MSSGEGRRILIARAMVHNPLALLLDEPSNSLDVSRDTRAARVAAETGAIRNRHPGGHASSSGYHSRDRPGHPAEGRPRFRRRRKGRPAHDGTPERALSALPWRWAGATGIIICGNCWWAPLVQRSSLCRANAGQSSRLHAHRGPDAGARNRRKHSNFQRGQCSPAPPAALQESPTIW